MVPADVSTLFAKANESWNAVFRSSMEKEAGSLASLDQVNVVDAPEVILPGMEKVMAETKGRKKKMTLAKGRLAIKKYSNRETPLNLKAERIVCERGE
jgi:hypothetical protein